ncbi:probable MNN2-type II membrane protein [Phialocephala subalpina]|uniref:Probable MNN2-type II membrane protein n=1 Tax=Phialocephala subalpina TaxID=576137 RepID=A0A1L7XJI5_9HELO|nr:probable MNN2-type II membrane protein [Phialocephala subalpina]
MRTTRIGTAAILLVIILSLLTWKRNEFTNYLPSDYLPEEVPEKVPEANNYFHTDETQRIQLAKVIQEFVDRPIQTWDEAVKLNSQTCPTEGINYDKGAVEENDQKWRAIPSTQISDWRHAIAAHLYSKHREEKASLDKRHEDLAVPSDGIAKEIKSGRGIVMAAGDRAAAIRARTNTRLLRSYNCTLPIEIFHFSSELSEPDKSLLEDLSQLESNSKVTIRLVQGIEKGNGWKAFQIKGAAIQQSSFDEILYLDTDSYPLRNPEDLFKSKHWKETGLLLWPDYTKSHATNPLWRLLGQQCRDEYEGESGQIFISRSRHQDVLWLVEYFAVHHEEFYGFMGGDRDSFRAAALLLNKPWAGPGRLNAAAGVVFEGNVNGGGHTMLQADMDGKWMFVHANLIKHSQFTQRPLWKTIHRAANDKFVNGKTYGSVEKPNDRLGLGVSLHVDPTPRMVTIMKAMEGYDAGVVVVEEWDKYEELRGFEEKWFGFGGVH